LAKRETLAVYVEFLKSSLDENIHPDRSLRSCTGESFGFSSRNVGPNFSVPSILHLFRKVGLTCSLGLELWEEGRRSDKIFQQGT
jgi:hypothetical protein